VVVDGADRLREGAAVRIVGDDKPQDAATAVDPPPATDPAAVGQAPKRHPQNQTDSGDSRSGASK
jgi:hypothetical protein